MLTPQQIQDISFEKALFGGYDMDSVDDILEPLTEDYVTLYKENSVLKSKMRILVEKLEEYRKQEASMQNALLAAQKTCDQMVADAEKKCAQMLHEAEDAASAKTNNVDALVGEEQERLDAAKAATSQFLDGMEKHLKRQLELIDELRRETPLTPSQPEEQPASSAPQAQQLPHLRRCVPFIIIEIQRQAVLGRQGHDLCIEILVLRRIEHRLPAVVQRHHPPSPGRPQGILAGIHRHPYQPMTQLVIIGKRLPEVFPAPPLPECI